MLPEAFFDLVVMQLEGGSETTNDPTDAGGLTKFGVSQKAFPSLDIANLTKEAARGIYEKHYWQAVRGDELPPALGLVAFDCAVNQGAVTAVKLLQKALRQSSDGVMGPQTMAAIKAAKPLDLVRDMMKVRSARYLGMNNAAEERFEAGWMNRLWDVFHAAVAIA